LILFEFYQLIVKICCFITYGIYFWCRFDIHGLKSSSSEDEASIEAAAHLCKVTFNLPISVNKIFKLVVILTSQSIFIYS